MSILRGAWLVIAVPAFLLGAYIIVGTLNWQTFAIVAGLAAIYVVIRTRMWERGG